MPASSCPTQLAPSLTRIKTVMSWRYFPEVAAA